MSYGDQQRLRSHGPLGARLDVLLGRSGESRIAIRPDARWNRLSYPFSVRWRGGIPGASSTHRGKGTCTGWRVGVDDVHVVPDRVNHLCRKLKDRSSLGSRFHQKYQSRKEENRPAAASNELYEGVNVPHRYVLLLP